MKSLNEFLDAQNANQQNDYLQFVNESVQNNVRMINEAKLIADHGKDLDNLLYKTKQYFNNHINNKVNEAENDYMLTLDEQETVRDLFIFCLEDFKQHLLDDCKVYEGLLNGEITIDETFKLGAGVKELWNQGKEKVEKFYNDAKTQINELNELIKAFANNTIQSLKEFANKIVEFIDKVGAKVGGSLLAIAEKIGFGKDKVGEISDELIDDLKANPDKVTKNNIFESLGKEIQQEMIDEGIVDMWNNSKLGKWIDEKKKHPLWNAFFQFCNWLLVCKLLPMVVLAICPGGLIYYVISIAVKFIWNLKKLGGLIQQTKDYIHGWNTFTPWDKIKRGCVLIANWGLWGYNIYSIGINAGPTFDALKGALAKGELWKQMLGAAHTGIEPDKYEAWGAAIIKWIGSGFKGSIADSHNSILEACKEAVGGDVVDAIKAGAELADKAAEINKNTEENIAKAKDLAQHVKKLGSNGLLKKLEELGIPIDKITGEKTYSIIMNGHSDANWFKQMIELAKENGIELSPEDLLHKGLNAQNPAAGSTVMCNLPGKLIKLAQEKGILGYENRFSILGEIADVATKIDLPPVVATFTAAMASDVPIITFKQKGNGFRVRLGESGSKNYIYEVGKDGVQFVKQSEINDDKVKKAYETIKKVIHDENVKLIEKMKKSDINEEQKKALDKKLEDFESQYKENLEKTPIVIISGKRVSEDEQKKYDGKESLISLYNYLVTEAEEESKKENTEETDKKKDSKKYSVDDVLLNLKDLRKHLNKKGEKNNTKNEKDKETFNGNVEIILRSVFSSNKKGKASKFTFDQDYKQEPYESVRKRAKNEDYRFGKKDVNILAYWYAKWYANDDKEYYAELADAFVDVIALKHQLANSDEVNSTIITIYKQMVDHLTQAEEFKKEIDGKEWEPNKQWAPLKFDESEVDPKIEDKLDDAEEKGSADMSQKEAEETIEKTGVTIPDDSNKKEEDKSSKEEPQEDEQDDGKDHPVLIFSNVYGMDIAKANEKGPRKEIYSLKGSFHSLEFIEIKKGMNKADIQEMLGEWMYTMVNNLNALTVELPFEKKKNWWKDKFIVNKNLTENDERKDFGNLTNGEIADIMNKKENAKNYVLTKTNSIIIAQSEDDKKFVEDKKKKYTEKLNNLSDEQKEIIKQIDPKAIGDDGKIDPKKKEEISDKLAGYKLAQVQATRDKKKKGLLSKLKSFVKGLFDGDKDEGKKYNSLLKTFDEDTNESLTINYDEFLEWCFKPMTLQEFIYG